MIPEGEHIKIRATPMDSVVFEIIVVEPDSRAGMHQGYRRLGAMTEITYLHMMRLNGHQEGTRKMVAFVLDMLRTEVAWQRYRLRS